jgi:acyl carrier protein
MDERSTIRSHLAGLLKRKGDARPFADGERLLVTGRLDSADVVEMVVLLETSFGVNFGERGFDPEVFECVDSLVEFISGPRERALP